MADLVGAADDAAVPDQLLFRPETLMGRIVGAFAMSHVLGSPEGQQAQAERVFAGMVEIGARLRATRPDLIVVLTSDHLNNFSLAEPTPFAIGVAASFTPFGDMGLPTNPFAGQPEFGTGFAAYANGHGLELAPLERVRPDHGVMIPLEIVDRDHAIPAVPLYVNSVFESAPAPPQCWRLGTLLAGYIRDIRPERERVALLAGGGLSHWLGNADEGRVNEAWDRSVIASMVSAQGERLAALSNEDILRDAGNGGLEVNAWIALAGAVPGATGECVFYEAMPAWASGMAGIALQPPA
jgi:protocatechuate 4,5-dioxygenase beta chain/2'-aminobiphenyl-2,3-diol 1,2-dioxygenase large subunit